MEPNRLDELEQRVAYLERTVKELQGDKARIVQAEEKQPQYRNGAGKKSGVQKPKTDWETVLFRTWLPRVFVFVFIVGVLWGFRAASEYGMLNEQVKIILGFLVSALFIAAGMKYMKSGKSMLAQILLGGSIPLLMLTTFAMNSLYGMIGPIVAFLLNVCWIAAGIYFTAAYRSEVLGIMSVIGGVLVPFLIEGTEPNAVLFVTYETVLYLVFLTLSVRVNYMKLYAVSAVLLQIALAVFKVMLEFERIASNEYIFGVAVIIQHVCLLLFFFRTPAQSQAAALFGSLFITYAWVYATWTDVYITIYLIGAMALYGALAYAYKHEEKKFPIFVVNALVLLFFYILYDVTEHLQATLLLLQAAAAYYISFRYHTMFTRIVSIFIYTIGSVLVLTHPIMAIWSYETVQWVFLLGTWLLCLRVTLINKKAALVMNAGSVVFAFLAVVFATQCMEAVTVHMAYATQTLVLTFVWMALAVTAIIIGLIGKVEQAKYIGLGLLVITLLKLIVLDLPHIPVFIKAILFIALGALGLVMSRLFYSKK